MSARSLSGHQRPNRGASDEWLTPPEIIDALGPFDLDPCAPIRRPWPTAAEHFTIDDDGLAQPWRGFVWMNPPFSEAALWLERLAEHGDGIALVAARTETRAFFAHVWGRADALVFLRSRPHFYTVEGERAPFNSGAPIVLVGYGTDAVGRLRSCGLGAFVHGAETAA